MQPIAAISQQIWDMKYRLKSEGGAPVDKTIEDTWRRIAGALADATGNYRAGFTLLALMAGCGSLFFVLAKKPT